MGVSAGANCLSLYAGVRGMKRMCFVKMSFFSSSSSSSSSRIGTACRFLALAAISNPFQIFATLGKKLKSDFVSRHVYDPFFGKKSKKRRKKNFMLLSFMIP